MMNFCKATVSIKIETTSRATNTSWLEFLCKIMKQTPSNYTKQFWSKLITQKKKLILLIFDSLTEVIKPSVAFPDGQGLEEIIF